MGTRVIAKQLTCGVAEVTDPKAVSGHVVLNAKPIPNGDGNKTQTQKKDDEKKNGLMSEVAQLGEDEHLSEPATKNVKNVTYCNVTKVMGTRSNTASECDKQCEIEL